MVNNPLHLLILEDNSDDAELAVKELERKGFTVEWTRVDTGQGIDPAIMNRILIPILAPKNRARAPDWVFRLSMVSLPVMEGTSECPVNLVKGLFFMFICL